MTKKQGRKARKKKKPPVIVRYVGESDQATGPGPLPSQGGPPRTDPTKNAAHVEANVSQRSVVPGGGRKAKGTGRRISRRAKECGKQSQKGVGGGEGGGG